MKTPLLLIAFLFLNVHCFFSQQTEIVSCGNDSIVRLSGFYTNIDLRTCFKNVEITTLNENTVIKDTLLVNINRSIRFLPKDDYSIRILPGDLESNNNIQINNNLLARGGIRRRTVVGAAVKEAKKPAPSVVEIEETKETIFLFPNPADERITINGIDKIDAYSIYNSQGMALLRGINPINNTILVSTLPTGLYYIHLQTNNEIISKTFYKN